MRLVLLHFFNQFTYGLVIVVIIVVVVVSGDSHAIGFSFT